MLKKFPGPLLICYKMSIVYNFWFEKYRSKASPVPELSFLTAPYSGWTRAGEKRVQDNLHAHAQNEPIKYHAARVNVSRNAFFSSRC